ncbi:MAG: hypothetical protein V2I57_13665 [Xanthomonadales bacterium]|jgi:hypothetical protein|nr:hypothetical protein [Xanthomonadales bacterium]
MEVTTQRAPSVGDWFVTIFVLGIPLVGLVFYLYWAFADGVNEAKQNFCRASLLWALIVIGLVLVMMALGFAGAVIGGATQSL